MFCTLFPNELIFHCESQQHAYIHRTTDSCDASDHLNNLFIKHLSQVSVGVVGFDLQCLCNSPGNESSSMFHSGTESLRFPFEFTQGWGGRTSITWIITASFRTNQAPEKTTSSSHDATVQLSRTLGGKNPSSWWIWFHTSMLWYILPSNTKL